MATLTRMPTADVNGIEICYQSLGPDEAPTCLLVMGLGAQMLLWPDGFVTELLDRGFRVVRFDNRDVGLSSVTPGEVPDIMAMMAARAAGEPVTAPYTFSDMAADAIGLLDHLEIDTAHIVGASLGGMIVQTMAFEHPERVASVTSIMSTTGADDVGQPDPAAMTALLTPPPPNAMQRSRTTSRSAARSAAPSSTRQRRWNAHARPSTVRSGQRPRRSNSRRWARRATAPNGWPRSSAPRS